MKLQLNNKHVMSRELRIPSIMRNNNNKCNSKKNKQTNKTIRNNDE